MAARVSSSRIGCVVGLLAVVLVLAVAAVAVGVVLQVRGDDEPPAAAPPPPTLADLAAAGPLVVPREGFCDRVPPTAVAAAVGGEPTGADTWANGDTARLTDEVEDVAHENGCAWTGADGTVARAWVFAPPITQARARRLATQVSGGAGCTPYGAEGFGDPTAAWTCGGDGTLVAGHAGLFGDAWLTCTVSVPETGVDPAAVRARAAAWCAAVGTASAA